jgi:hypothetical protein
MFRTLKQIAKLEAALFGRLIPRVRPAINASDDCDQPVSRTQETLVAANVTHGSLNY